MGEQASEVIRNVALAAGILKQILCVRMPGEEQYFAIRVLSLHLNCEINPREAGHCNVRNQQVGRCRLSSCQCFQRRGESFSTIAVQL